MDGSVFSAWLAAVVSLLALLVNVFVQLWQVGKANAHQVNLQEQQLKFDKESLEQSAELAYAAWLRDKRLDAMFRIHSAVEETLSAYREWVNPGIVAGGGEAFDERAKSAGIELTSALQTSTHLFAHPRLLEDFAALESSSKSMLKLIFPPEEPSSREEKWRLVLDYYSGWKEDFNQKYARVWMQLNKLTVPMPSQDSYLLDVTSSR